MLLNIDIEFMIRDIKNIIPSINVIITGNTGIVLIDNDLRYSTQGNNTNEMIKSYLSGMQIGITFGLKHK